MTMTYKKINISGEYLVKLEKHFKQAQKEAKYKISFAEFVAQNAVWNLER